MSSSLSLKINLISCDNRTFEVEKEVAMQCQVLKTMLENVDDSDTGTGSQRRNDTIPFKHEHLTGDALEKVIEWIKYHLEVEKNEENEIEAAKWDEDFVKGLGDPKGLLSDVLMAANYLDIKDLLDICITAVANKIRGKGVYELQQMFNLQVEKSGDDHEDEEGEVKVD